MSAKNGSVMGSPICNTKDGNVYYSWDESLTTGVTGNGAMCTLTFQIKDTCKPGDKISIQLTQFKAHDTDLNDVTVQLSNGGISDSEYINWISSTSYTLDAGSAAYDLIKKALGATVGALTMWAIPAVIRKVKK